MEFAVKQAGRNAVVAFSDRVNLEGDDSVVFKDKLKAFVADGHDRVVMDLGNVAFMDSHGLGALIGALKALKQAEGHLVLANVSEPVAAVLRVTRLDRVFDVKPTVEEALHLLDRLPVPVGRGA